MRTLLAVSATMLAVLLATGIARGAGQIDKEMIDATLSGFIQSRALVGVSALVYQNGQEAYFGAFGQADREAGRPMRRDTLVQIMSTTKPITGVALMTLYEADKFQLDDPVSKYLPEFANLHVYAGKDHTPVGEIYRAGDPTSKTNTLAEEARKLASLPLLFQPGTRWLYGASVDVQAYLVERLSGMPFDKYLEKTIFKPLGMKDTRYVLRAQDHARMAALYQRHEDRTLSREPDDTALEFNNRDWPMKPGSFGLVSTLDDYMRFARMLQNGGELDGKRILQSETVRLMATDAMPADVGDTSWLLTDKGQVGFGIDFAVRIRPPANARENSGEVGEFFWDGADDTLFWVDPKNKITAVLFTQYRPFGKVPLHKAFRDAVCGGVPEALAH